jgi:hypothetical protein
MSVVRLGLSLKSQSCNHNNLLPKRSQQAVSTKGCARRRHRAGETKEAGVRLILWVALGVIAALVLLLLVSAMFGG